MPLINEDLELKTQFLNKLTESYSQQKEGLFVTDFCYCLRKAFWRRAKPKPYNERTLGFFVDGSRRHEVLQDLSDYKAEVSISKYGIRGRLDLLGDLPIELKTTRSRNTVDIAEHYLKQLAIYCLFTDKNEGILVIQYLNEGCWKFHRITFTPEELATLEKELLEHKNLLEQALKTLNFKDLPYPPQWECAGCDYKKECEV